MLLNCLNSWSYRHLFQFICTSATIAFICFCLYKYSQNDDVSQVTFQEFHKKKDNLYPSVSICVSSIFYEENLKSYGDGINISTYTDFMNGEYWDDRIVKVDYDNVTLNFSNYIIQMNNTSSSLQVSNEGVR